MSVPPLINMPVSSCAASVKFAINRVVGVTSSPYSLSSQTFKWPGEQWMADFDMPPMTNKETAYEWKAFGVALEGKYGMFLLGDPSAKVPVGVGTGSPKVDGAGQLGNTLNTKDWTPGIEGIMKAGDMFQLGSGLTARLYMVVEDADTDTSGDTTLVIQPALRSSPADGAAIVVNNPVGLFRLSSNSFSWQVTPGPVWRMSFQAEEVISA